MHLSQKQNKYSQQERQVRRGQTGGNQDEGDSQPSREGRAPGR